MSWKYKLKGKLAIQLDKLMPSVYQRFTLSQTKKKSNKVESPVVKPLSVCRVALVTSAGVHLKDDKPFDVLIDGDYTYRIIPGETDMEALEVTHLYYETKHARIDPSIVFPLPQLRKLAKQGVIGTVSNTNVGLNGGTLNQDPHEKETAPKVVDELKKDDVDLVLLVPG
ncbi:MAG: glycine/sarcosine/betaine reductase selenoprotein B family protein [Bacillota bacterium]